ncbi:metallothionein-2-like [Cricetulus griseus]|uniref:Metallothionein n=1 Tax=Cricetulus griseus TaxID=10029 RepID=A0A9J7KD85_CRIGR|nr:metallothionein-2-like [Cricetulus griseus]
MSQFLLNSAVARKDHAFSWYLHFCATHGPCSFKCQEFNCTSSKKSCWFRCLVDCSKCSQACNCKEASDKCSYCA